MIVQPLKSMEEAIQCLDMYLEYDKDDFLEKDRNRIIKSMQRCLTNNYQVRLIKEGSVVIAWIMFKDVFNEAMGIKVIQQSFYCSNVRGITAVKCVKLLHRELIEYAKKMKIRKCISTCSHNDTEFRFCKLLEKDGWATRGYIAMYDVK